jgi:two-component system response regulator FixJ
MLVGHFIDRPMPHAPTDARVYVIDDHSDVRVSLHLLLGTVGIKTWPFANPCDFLEQLFTLPPAPILLDVRMPDLDGVEVLSELARRECTWPVIVMTAHGDVAVAVKLMKLGALEFLEKPFSLEAAVIALNQAYDLLATATLANATVGDAQRRFASLTPRQSDVVAGLLCGAPNKIVAHELGLSIRTVEMYRADALKKLGTRNMVETATLAHRAKWTGPVALPL